MATEENKNGAPGSGSQSGAKAASQPASQQGFVYLPLIAGWLVPGAGHFLLGKWVRGSLLAASVLGMFVTGLAMHGQLYTSVHNILDILCMAGDLGNGLLYMAGRVAVWGAEQAQTTVADWGARFIVVAGLLNVIAAVDAHNLRTGRKS
jgi:TM2 domain-containing membrane protein YozV